MRKVKKAATPYLFLLPTILLMVILLVIPICMIFQYSFLNNAIVEKNPVFVGLENYSEILSDRDFWNAAKKHPVFCRCKRCCAYSAGDGLCDAAEFFLFWYKNKNHCQGNLCIAVDVYGLCYRNFVETYAAAPGGN